MKTAISGIFQLLSCPYLKSYAFLEKMTRNKKFFILRQFTYLIFPNSSHFANILLISNNWPLSEKYFIVVVCTQQINDLNPIIFILATFIYRLTLFLCQHFGVLRSHWISYLTIGIWCRQVENVFNNCKNFNRN